MSDYFTDDILGNNESPKRKNSSRKGKDGERHIVGIFNDRFNNILAANPSWGRFYRSVGSGSRTSQVNLSHVANNLYAGDIICERFKFVIESKNGYDIDFVTAFDGNKQIDAFLSQVSKDAERCQKMPMLIWKKDRRRPLVFLKEFSDFNTFKYRMYYREWVILSLRELLDKMPDEFFFTTLN